MQIQRRPACPCQKSEDFSWQRAHAAKGFARLRADGRSLTFLSKVASACAASTSRFPGTASDPPVVYWAAGSLARSLKDAREIVACKQDDIPVANPLHFKFEGSWSDLLFLFFKHDSAVDFSSRTATQMRSTVGLKLPFPSLQFDQFLEQQTRATLQLSGGASSAYPCRRVV